MESVGRLIQSPSSSPRQNPYSCEVCQDTSWEPVAIEGIHRGVRPCRCSVNLHREAALEIIDEEFRSLALESLKPDLAAHPKQRDLIPKIKQQPEASYILCGDHGTGKSMVGWVLYRRAVLDGRPAAAMTVAELLKKYRAWETRGVETIVSAETLRTDRRRWYLFLDEFEKARVTDFAAEMLCELIDAAYANHHQVVVATNLTIDDLHERWARESVNFGYAMVSKLLRLKPVLHVSMFRQ